MSEVGGRRRESCAMQRSFEQSEGEPGDAREDVWGMGYEDCSLLTLHILQYCPLDSTRHRP
jgi:hypothetical protein